MAVATRSGDERRLYLANGFPLELRAHPLHRLLRSRQQGGCGREVVVTGRGHQGLRTIDLATRLPGRVLPITADAPKDLHLMIEDEMKLLREASLLPDRP